MTFFSRLSMLAFSVTSQTSARDRRPSASTSAAAVFTSSARRPVGTTLAPALDSALVMASPMPLVPPMTTAVLLLRSRSGWPIEVTLSSRKLYRQAGMTDGDVLGDSRGVLQSIQN